MARGKSKGGADQTADGPAPLGPLTGMEAVRRALGELGYDAETQTIHDHVRDSYGKEMSNNMISSYKSTLRREAGVSKGRGGRTGGRGATAGVLQVKDVQAVKDLVNRLGADRVRELIDVFH